ncbi:MAG TPA: phosphate ABC transporter permease subunit PstC [Mycobacteriales bacterium]|jgi:phosphate transport system permease protein|nr:phosphate ABC transporter permease subunit PstC [Mycobacteriales bacterium]
MADTTERTGTEEPTGLRVVPGRADSSEIAADITGDAGSADGRRPGVVRPDVVRPDVVRPDTAGAPATPPDRTPIAAAPSTRRGDAVFRGMSLSAGTTVLVIMAAIAVFLVYQAVPALRANDAGFFTTKEWFPDPSTAGGPSVFGIAALAFHTAVTSIIAMTVAVPVAIGIALFITYYAPRRLASALGYVVDLLAAVPSIVFGLWGAFFLAPNLTGVALFLDRWLGWTVLLSYRPDSMPANRSDFTAGLVLAIMILPIVSALAREVFRQVPTPHVEGALALGATRWEMIRMSVLPFGRAGVVSAAILGLGRALGETLAVTLILSSAYNINLHILEDGGVTFASNIALKYNEAGAIGTGALVASGLVLFLLTLGVNSLSQYLLRRQLKG